MAMGQLRITGHPKEDRPVQLDKGYHRQAAHQGQDWRHKADYRQIGKHAV